jgi:hypothetical protein
VFLKSKRVLQTLRFDFQIIGIRRRQINALWVNWNGIVSSLSLIIAFLFAQACQSMCTQIGLVFNSIEKEN